MSDSKAAPLSKQCIPSAEHYCEPKSYPNCEDLENSGKAYRPATKEMFVLPKSGEDSSAKQDEFVFYSEEEAQAFQAQIQKLGEAMGRPNMSYPSPFSNDDPNTTINDSQVDRAWYEGHLGRNAFNGICKKSWSLKGGGDAQHQWFGWMTYPRFIAFQNEVANDILMDQSEVNIPPEDMEKIIEVLGLNEKDVALKPGGKPKVDKDGKFGLGAYYFIGGYTRPQQILEALGAHETDLINAGVSRKSYDDVKNHLEKVNEAANIQLEATKDNSSWMKWMIGSQIFVGFISLAVTMGAMRWQVNKTMKPMLASNELQKKQFDLYKKQLDGDSDANKFEKFADDFVEMQKERLSQDILANEIRGRDKEAIQLLIELSDMDASNPRLTGSSGVGKDKVAERAAQLIALRDPRVPRQFYDGTIKGFWKIDYNKFTAQAGIVGHSGQRLKSIEGKMKEGYAVYLSEIADIMTMGSHSGGGSESFASGMKGAVTQPYSKFASSTTPESWDAIVRQNPQLVDYERRFPVIEVSDLPVDTLRKIFNEVRIPKLEAYHKVKILPDARETAINLALLTMSDQSSARYDAIDGLLREAIRDAVMTRPAFSSDVIVITKEDIARIVSRQKQVSISSDAKFDDPIKGSGYDEGKYFGDALMKDMEKDKWFSTLQNGERREAVRIAGSLLLGEGGDRFRNADGSIKVKELATEAKAGMSTQPASSSKSASRTSGQSSAASSSSGSAPVSSNPQIEMTRKALIREAEEAERAGVTLKFDIRKLSPEDQIKAAERAYAVLSKVKKNQKKYLATGEGGARFKPGAAHKLLIEAERSDPQAATAELEVMCKDMGDVAKASERAAKAAEKAKGKGWFDFIRKIRG